jgi:hypothetical protein
MGRHLEDPGPPATLSVIDDPGSSEGFSRTDGHGYRATIQASPVVEAPTASPLWRPRRRIQHVHIELPGSMSRLDELYAISALYVVREKVLLGELRLVATAAERLNVKDDLRYVTRMVRPLAAIEALRRG